MKPTQAFKTELANAIRLSAFITLMVFGMLYVQSRSGEEAPAIRRVASPDKPTNSSCYKGEDGKLYRYSRATPPYDKIECN